MMDNFIQILRWMSTTMETPSTRNHFIGEAPFKVHVNFYIHLFEGHTNTHTLEKWLSLLEGYFFVQNFSNGEKITFILLKYLQHVIYWWETYFEQHDRDESAIFWAKTHLGVFFLFPRGEILPCWKLQ
jgi:hypothetical protein